MQLTDLFLINIDDILLHVFVNFFQLISFLKCKEPKSNKPYRLVVSVFFITLCSIQFLFIIFYLIFVKIYFLHFGHIKHVSTSLFYKMLVIIVSLIIFLSLKAIC